MARKSAAMLKSAPVKLNKASRQLLAQLDKIEPVEGCEEQWQRYLAAARENEEVQSRYDALYALVEREGGTSEAKSWAAFQSAGKDADRAIRAAFGTLDSYQHAVAHRNDAKYAPEDDVRGVLAASLSDKLDGLKFTVNSGILASKVAQAIRSDVTETELDVPYCADHS